MGRNEDSMTGGGVGGMELKFPEDSGNKRNDEVRVWGSGDQRRLPEQ
jgi:hypothetical protein